MHIAAKEGNEYTIKGLVEQKADINTKDNDGVSEIILLLEDRLELATFPSTQEKALL